MAFDYGSIDLGLRNPFKKEGAVTAIRGLVETAIGAFLLTSAASIVREDMGTGWVLIVFGVLMLGMGIRVTAAGTYATLKYFVGRNHPTSLSTNYSRSERSTSKEESAYVAYTDSALEEMLVGRKNATFLEPKGFLGRLAHSLLPKLLFMPYPIRNSYQRLFGVWAKTLTAIVAYALVSFVSLAGFAGDAGELAFPLYSLLLMLYIAFIWRSAGRPISRIPEKTVESAGSAALVEVVVLSLLVPIVIGVALSWWMAAADIPQARVEGWLAFVSELHTAWYFFGIFVLAGLSTAVLVYLLRRRFSIVEPTSEVSELRENWQESIHPDEIFINLDNLVMANRRFREVPNRVYRALDPVLEEQVQGKGKFIGELIQEVQPRVRALDMGAGFIKARMISLISGSLLFIAGMVATLLLSYACVDIYAFLKNAGLFSGTSPASVWNSTSASTIKELLNPVFHLLLIGFIMRSFAALLTNVAHLFFAEIQFESLLVYFKCEGTFTESKISTGASIHDSTRSENTLVRSSITPWVIVSRIVTSMFAATGIRNLEHPRYVLEMHKDDSELQAIRRDLIIFMKDRESIASITNERDLGNATAIHQLNQQTRAIHDMARKSLEQDEQAAGYLRQQEESDKPG